MIARCVVESGTSSFYSAIRDSADNRAEGDRGPHRRRRIPHYKLFLETLNAQDEPELPWWRRVLVAATRVNESSDDELAYAYYWRKRPCPRKACSYSRKRFAPYHHAMRLYRPITQKAVQMCQVRRADPQGRPTRAARRCCGAYSVSAGFAPEGRWKRNFPFFPSHNVRGNPKLTASLHQHLLDLGRCSAG